MRVFGYRLFPIAVLALLGIGAYWNSLHAPFVFDDIDSVERNRLVHFANQYYNQFSAYPSPRSLLFLTFAFNNWLNGQNPLGYHVVNLVVHILNGFLVFAIARRIYNASPTGREVRINRCGVFSGPPHSNGVGHVHFEPLGTLINDGLSGRHVVLHVDTRTKDRVFRLVDDVTVACTGLWIQRNRRHIPGRYSFV